MMWLAVLAVLSASQVVTGLLNTTSIVIAPDGSSIYPCLQVNHREPELDTSLMGVWYVVEIIQHRENPKQRVSQTLDICPQLNLYQSHNYVKITWLEKAGDVHYNFKMVDPENSGYWIVWGRQNGSLLNKGYDQFAGSVQVIEAKPTRMVLMFCAHNLTHYSTVMVRNFTTPHDTRDTHKTLSDYGVPEVSVRQTCKNNNNTATRPLPILATVLPLLILLAMRVY